MKDSLIIKNKIKKAIYDKVFKIDEVISITIVGSFIDKNDLSGISDIDTIIICNILNKKIFNKCIKACKELDLNKYGLEDYKLKINSKFGPLKFDKPKVAILHLMIYDIAGHREHVINSPFTCYDWERSQDFVGLHLKEIFPVGQIQLRDFKEARRNIKDYLSDLKNNSITYHEYDFSIESIKQVKKHMKLDDRHKGEFAYHIVRNLINNYYKLCSNHNRLISGSEINKIIKSMFNKEYGKYHSKKFTIISKNKEKRKIDFPIDTIDWIEKFIKEFKTIIFNNWKSASKINFIRHFKTPLNDGRYLGQSSNPEIDLNNIRKNKMQNADIVYSSPLLRCIQSANIIHKNTNVIQDNRLLEFDYGDADGLQYKDFANLYPNIISDWEYDKDPHFPNGENTNDVLKRLLSFMHDLSKNLDKKSNTSISIFTHNGILRCLIGNYLKIEKKDWYKIFIPHGIVIEFLYHNGMFFPNISRQLLSKILKNIGKKN